MTDDDLDLVGTDALIEAFRRRTTGYTIIFSTNAKKMQVSMATSSMADATSHAIHLDEFVRAHIRRDLQFTIGGV